jgi:hypothetical protein
MRQAADPNPDISVPATLQLVQISRQQGYTQLLIQAFSQNVNTPFGFWCSISLKSHILQYWEVTPGEEDVLSEADRAAVKQTLVSMLLGCPPEQKAQIIHAIGIVSVSDFPTKWPNLIYDLTAQLCMFSLFFVFCVPPCVIPNPPHPSLLTPHPPRSLKPQAQRNHLRSNPYSLSPLA